MSKWVPQLIGGIIGGLLGAVIFHVLRVMITCVRLPA